MPNEIDTDYPHNAQPPETTSSDQYQGAYDSYIKIKELEKNSTTDSLTGLSNRRGLDHDKTKFEVDRYPILFISVDLDNLKGINDTFGHKAGDKYIMSFVEFINTITRPDDDNGYRLGGDEFLVVVRNHSNNQNLKQTFEDRIVDSLKKFNENKLSNGEIDHELRFTSFIEESHIVKPEQRLEEIDRALKASDEGEVKLKDEKKAQKKSQNQPSTVP